MGGVTIWWTAHQKKTSKIWRNQSPIWMCFFVEVLSYIMIVFWYHMISNRQSPDVLLKRAAFSAPPIFGAGFATAFLPGRPPWDSMGWPAFEPPEAWLPPCAPVPDINTWRGDPKANGFGMFWDTIPKLGNHRIFYGNLVSACFGQDVLWSTFCHFGISWPTTRWNRFPTLWKQHSRLAASHLDAQKIGILCHLGCTTIFNCHSAFMSCQKFALMGKSTDFTHDNPNISKQAHRYLVIVGSPAVVMISQQFSLWSRPPWFGLNSKHTQLERCVPTLRNLAMCHGPAGIIRNHIQTLWCQTWCIFGTRSSHFMHRSIQLGVPSGTPLSSQLGRVGRSWWSQIHCQWAMLSKDGVGHTLKPLQQTFIIAKMTAVGTATCPLKKCQFIKDSCKNKIRNKREVACVLCVS